MTLLICGAGLLACSSVNTITFENVQIPITKEYEQLNSIDSLISPYRSELNKEMLEIIAVAPKGFDKGKPNGALNNWSTDVIYNSQLDKMDNSIPSFCLLNWGGLRNSISKGDVTLGDIFKLMPFDNEIVIVELPMRSLGKIEEYLISRNGEPIAGAFLKQGKISFLNVPKESHTSFFVVTSDYLMNGGDNMNFFEDRISTTYAGELLRDVMISAAEKQATLIWNNEQRIIIE